MPRVATSARRQLVMATLLALAVAGAVIRHEAPNPSTLRDIGTLLLVMWLPAVGNLIAFLIRKIPRRAPGPPPSPFAAGTPFVAHVLVALEPVQLPDGFAAALAPADDHGTLIAGSQGFSVRLDRPVAQWLAAPASPVALQCLRPDVALKTLAPGTTVHLLVHMTAIASGRTLPASGDAAAAVPQIT